jgi:hypothetical protein|tara:strand:- start:880 stop:1053 length:174 start_codon:yes stop_codon:yes gene_type:complete
MPAVATTIATAAPGISEASCHLLYQESEEFDTANQGILQILVTPTDQHHRASNTKQG